MILFLGSASTFWCLRTVDCHIGQTMINSQSRPWMRPNLSSAHERIASGVRLVSTICSKGATYSAHMGNKPIESAMEQIQYQADQDISAGCQGCPSGIVALSVRTKSWHADVCSDFCDQSHHHVQCVDRPKKTTNSAPDLPFFSSVPVVRLFVEERAWSTPLSTHYITDRNDTLR